MDAKFWLNVRKGDGPSDCWEWTGKKVRNGYGKVHLGGRGYVAHRYAYERTVGPIPAGLVLDHLCRNRSCVNPAHLRPCTNRENVLAAGSESRTAINAAKTTCPLDHPYDAVNTYNLAANDVSRRPMRRCRVCNREAQRRRRQRIRTPR